MVDLLEVRRSDRARSFRHRWISGAILSGINVVLVGVLITFFAVPRSEDLIVPVAGLAFIAGWFGASVITGEEQWLLNRFHED